MGVPPREFHHLFRKKMYKVKVTGYLPHGRDGDCDSPNTPNKMIRIRKNVGEKRFLTASLDEGIHACLFDLDNDVVDDVSNSIGNFLWKLGFRLVRDNEMVVRKRE